MQAYAARPRSNAADTRLDPAVADLPREMLQAITAAADRDTAHRALLGVLVSRGLVRAALWMQRNAEDELQASLAVPREQATSDAQAFLAAARTAAGAACRSGEARQADELAGVIAVPVFRRGQLPDALAVLVEQRDSAAAREAVVLAATHATLADLMADVAEVNQSVRATAAMLEILERIEGSADLTNACSELADQLQRYFDEPADPAPTEMPERRQPTRVAVAVCRRGRARLDAISRSEKFDRHSEIANAMEAALDECLLRGAVTAYPAPQEDAAHALRAHQRLASLTECPHVVSVPLQEADGNAWGGILLFGDNQSIRLPRGLRFLETLGPQVTQALELLSCARRVRLRERMLGIFTRRKTLWAGCLLTALLGVLLIPVPYRVKCDCELQPATRRFVAAPYDAKLAQALVGPGDVVDAQEILARVDDREMRWELEGVLVELDRARKKHDAALSKQNVAEAQLAKFEIERLELRHQLLQRRIAHLEIKSPVAGIVLSGDLERTEGAPLSIGETLFEIAPLRDMLVEIAIPESEVSHVQAGDPVQVLLDAYPKERWQGAVLKIHPRAELRDDESVFIAEVALDNSDGHLRPGMKGTARIEVDPHPLGWNLFHKPWEALLKAYYGL